METEVVGGRDRPLDRCRRCLADYTDGVIRIGVLNDRAFRPLAESDCPLIKK